MRQWKKNWTERSFLLVDTLIPTSSPWNSEEERDRSTSTQNSKKASKASQTAPKSKERHFSKTLQV